MMNWLIHTIESFIRTIPLQLLDALGRLGYIIGLIIMLCAYGGITFRPGGKWGFGREITSWDSKAFVSILITFVLIISTGYLGSFIVLVPGAQTFESLKDLMVFLCILLFGFPALLIVPFAYGVSDLIEGIPPDFLLDWWTGYFINPSCFWIAYQFFGKNPDFKKSKTWLLYLIFVILFMSIEPILWGYICSDKFTPEYSYHNITPALFFTTSITWMIAPFAMLAALPLARKFKMFWAEIPGRAKEKFIRHSEWVWVSGKEQDQQRVNVQVHGLPIRVILVTPFIALVLVMVVITAYITLKGSEDGANKLAKRLHEEIALNINMQLDDYLVDEQRNKLTVTQNDLNTLMSRINIARHGRAFILDHAGELVATSLDLPVDIVVQAAKSNLLNSQGKIDNLSSNVKYKFAVIKEKPLSRETWMAQATPYRNDDLSKNWLVVTAFPESYYFKEIQMARSQSALIFAIAIILSLIIAAILSAVLTEPILKIARATKKLTQGDLTQRLPESNIEELNSLTLAFDKLAAHLQKSFIDLSQEAEARKKRELELQQTEKELRKSRDEALHSSEVKSEFLANMSHEIRTPLNAILGMTELLKETPLNKEQFQFIQVLVKSGEHLLGLVNDLLDLAMLEFQSNTLQKTDFNLYELVSASMNFLAPLAFKKGLRLVYEIDQHVPKYVKGDAQRLRQIFINLLNNAVKFTETGYVKLQIDKNMQDPNPGALIVSVIDTGVGIPAEKLSAVFERFVQVNSSVNKKYAGSGLGLSITKKLLELMGETIQVESIEGKGTRFYFQLHLEIGKENSAPDAAIPTFENRNLKILIADDSEDNVMLMRHYLSKMNFQVEIASNGKEAVEKFKNNKFDIVFMDIQMPIMDGYSATQAIRAYEVDHKLPRTPIMALTAYVLKEEEEKSLRAGCDMHLAKPIKKETILKIVANIKNNF